MSFDDIATDAKWDEETRESILRAFIEERQLDGELASFAREFLNNTNMVGRQARYSTTRSEVWIFDHAEAWAKAHLHALPDGRTPQDYASWFYRKYPTHKSMHIGVSHQAEMRRFDHYVRSIARS